MPFASAQLIKYPVPEAHQTLVPKDCILFALSVGFGTDPTDRRQLRFIYERGLRALPMMANVLAHPGFWMQRSDTGVDWRRVLYGEHALTIHHPIPVEGTFVGRTRITAILDKGPETGAFVYVERRVLDESSGNCICTLEQTAICRGDGGCGTVGMPPPAAPHSPQWTPDLVCDLPTPPSAALLYRLNGDLNPLHVDPEVADVAGYPRPILHGLCSFGYAGHAVLRTCCGYDEARIRSMRARFTAPVFPGETIRTEMRRDGGTVAFRCLSLERSVVVLNRGTVELTAG